MSDTRKNNKKSFTTGVFILFILLLVAVAAYALGFHNGKASVTSDLQQGSGTQKEENKKEELEEGFKVETAYGDLYFPLKWKDNTEIVILDENIYTVQFHGTKDGKELVHLFDIVFGGEEGFQIGWVKTSSGESVTVSIVSYNFERAEDWTEQEYNTYCGMQEDVNYIIKALQKNKNFEEV